MHWRRCFRRGSFLHPVDGTQICHQRAAEQRRVNALHDKHDARSTILVRPLVEVNGRMNHVLDTVKDYRPGGVGHPQQALHPQYLGAVTMQQQSQPDAEGGPVDFFLDAQRERLDVDRVVAAQMDVFAMVVVFMAVVFVTVVMLRVQRRRANAGPRRVWSADRLRRRQQSIGVEATGIDVQNPGGGIEPEQCAG